VPASASAFACACACARILPRPRHSPEVRLAGEYRPRRVRRGPALHRTRTVIGWKARPETSRGPTGDPSRPVVSPTYAQGSYYGTNRVVAGAPGRLMGPAAPLPSTTRAAQPPGRDPSRLGSSVVRTARVSWKNRARGRPPRLRPPHGYRPKALGRPDGALSPELSPRGWYASGARHSPAPCPPRAHAAWSAEHEPKPRPVVRPPTGPEIGTYERASACSGGSPGRLRRKSGGSPGPAEVRWAPGADMAPGAINRAGAVARGCVRGRASRYVPPPRRRPPRRHDSGASLRRRPDAAAPTPRTRHGAPTLPRCGPRPQTAARRYNPGRCRTPSSS